ncbi:MAG: methyltransferase dimerization domain-containing protein, partial [Lentisphaeria bacterium]|nr:methyltransferase dimerization domain-containing protein [Lentisphaeria bacterium]
MEDAPNPGPLFDLSVAFWRSGALFAGIELKLFDTFAGNSMTPSDVAGRLDLPLRTVELLIEALAALDLLVVDDRGSFRNTDMSNTYLCVDSPAYLGDTIRFNARAWDAWGGLADAVRAELLPSAADGPQPGDGGPAGMYLTFDELDDMVIVDDLPLTGPFTVAFGFRASAELSEGFRYLYGHGNINQSNHLNVYLTTAGTLRTSLRGSGDAPDFDALDVSGELRDGAWHHVAVVVVPGDPSEATVYVDGVESASAPRGGPDFDP